MRAVVVEAFDRTPAVEGVPEPARLEPIGTAMHDVLAGKVPARIVFELSHLE